MTPSAWPNSQSTSTRHTLHGTTSIVEATLRPTMGVVSLRPLVSMVLHRNDTVDGGTNGAL